MSAAHELIQRGFQVVVLEARDIPGGKARSIAATPDGLPGEHGFRFFPSFYRHICDTMAGIPFPGNANGVFDNLVDTAHTAIARFGHDLVRLNGGFPTRPDQFFDLALGLLGNPFGLEPEETRFVGERLMQVATSCEERRVAEYEQIGWWSFIEADRFSVNYRKVLGSTTRSLVAADPRKASARTIGDITLQAILGVTTPGKVYDRVLNGPTSAAWIE
ncbi:MAG TPA: NAD(P)-binding protein, partial [Nevskiaceae bacterium]|nr:NAD(P)-binding protein [Nevskiaceae bacterium]